MITPSSPHPRATVPAPSTPSRRPTGLALLAVAAVLALLLAACGSSDATAAEPEAEADTSASSTDAAANADSDGDAGSAEDTEDADDGAPAADDGADGEASAGSSASGYLGDYTLIDEGFGTMTTVVVDGDTRTIETNALPDHETGEFPNQGNPNTITAQDLTWAFPATGTLTGTATEVRTTGVALNGVKFEPGTAETLTCSSGQTYRIEALQEVYDLGLDFNNAHVQPTGEYHYHGISELLVDAYDDSADLVHIGFASDGFLIYYSKSGAYDSSYVLSTDARTGTGCVASGPGGGDAVDIEGTTPDGTYTSDYAYVEGAGDLDACNGTTIDGEYAYVVTDAYPYVSRCLMGEVAAGAGGGPGPGGSGEGAQGAGGGQPGGALPDFSEAAAALGVTEDELLAVLPGPGADLTEAAEVLGVTVEELQAVLPAPPGA